MARVSFVVLLAGLALAGCGGSTAGPSGVALPGPPVRASVPSLADDIRLTKHVPCLSARSQRVGPDAVARFHAVTALLCDYGVRNDRNFISWNVRIRKVATASVADVQRYFEQHSERASSTSVACSAVAVGIFVPVLVDGRGRWLVPETPVDSCNWPLGGYEGVARRLHWRVVSVNKVSHHAFGQGGCVGTSRPCGSTAGPLDP